MTFWDGLTPPYGTIVVDPPWKVPQAASNWGRDDRNTVNAAVPYETMAVDDIKALPIGDLTGDYAHLYLWSVNRYMGQAFDVVRAWGFGRPTVLTWCKPPKGIGPGREFASTTEFVLFARKGTNPERGKRTDSSWWLWDRAKHSEKPQPFYDIVRTVSPGPYIEVFARRVRPGWDGWGDEYQGGVMYCPVCGQRRSEHDYVCDGGFGDGEVHPERDWTVDDVAEGNALLESM